MRISLGVRQRVSIGVGLTCLRVCPRGVGSSHPSTPENFILEVGTPLITTVAPFICPYGIVKRACCREGEELGLLCVKK